MSGYSNLYKICQNNSCCSALTSNRHFLEPNNPIYFCNDPYINERLNLKPSYWGRPAWTFLYSVAEGYGNHPTMEEKRQMYNFISSLNTALPCKKCRDNFNNYELSEFNWKYLQNSETLKEWVSEMERRVSERKEYDGEDSYKQENYQNLNHIRKYNQENHNIEEENRMCCKK